MRRLSLIVVGAVALACGQPPASTDPSQEVVKEEEPAEHIAVQLEQRGADCVGTHPVEGDKDADGEDLFKIRVDQGDLVKWTFKNDCDGKMMVGIDNFDVPERYREKELKIYPPNGERPVEDRCPLEEGCALKLEVAAGGSKVLEGHIKKAFDQPNITWKYDIVRYEDKEKSVLLDPELEVPRLRN